MKNSERPITTANDDTLTKFIRSATRRLVFLAPAASKAAAEALADRWRVLGAGAVSIILDVHPEVYRLGYGDPEALALLHRTARELQADLSTQSGIRIGLIVADDATLVYSPTPLLIEAGPKRYETPNAILLGAPPSQVPQDLDVNTDSTVAPMIGQSKASEALIENVKADLAQNPPQQFDIARTVRVFNAYFEYVEFELQGTFIERHVAPIPADLMGLARDEKAQRLLKASFRIVDEESELSSKPLQDQKAKLTNEYLILLPGYGHVILRTVKPAFEDQVKKLRQTVSEFQEQVKAGLQASIVRNRDALVKALLPGVMQSPPARWRKYFPGKPDPTTARHLLETELARSFGTARQFIKEMKVNVLFKAVTYESLTNPAFMETAKKKLPNLDQLFYEFDAAQAKERHAK